MYSILNYQCMGGEGILLNNTKFLTREQEELVTKNINLVHYLAKRINIGDESFYDYDDIFQIGTIGLMKAARTYNGMVNFCTYAGRCINNEIYMFFRKKRNFIPAKSLNENVNQNLDDEDIEMIQVIAGKEDVYLEVEQMNNIELAYTTLLNNFSYDEILILLYMADYKKQKEIGGLFNFSQSYISRIQIRIIADLKVYMDNNVMKSNKFRIGVKTDECIISFYTYDNLKIETMIFDLQSKFRRIKDFNVNYVDNRVIISFKNKAYLLDVVVDIIEKIRDNCIKVETLY